MGRDLIVRYPYHVGGILCIFITFVAILFHFFNVRPHDWEGMIMWLPVLWGLVFAVPVGGFWFDKIRRRSPGEILS